MLCLNPGRLPLKGGRNACRKRHRQRWPCLCSLGVEQAEAQAEGAAHSSVALPPGEPGPGISAPFPCLAAGHSRLFTCAPPASDVLDGDLIPGVG